MYLEKLILINYRSCNLLELDLFSKEPNILIGINDCGKTTILKAVEMLLSIKPIFNFVQDDKKKNDLSNTRANPEAVNAIFEKSGLPSFPYDEKKCLLIGKFFIEEEELKENKINVVTPQLLWVLDNIESNVIWFGKVFDESNQNVKDFLLTPDFEDNGNLLKLYNSKDTDLNTRISNMSIKSQEIGNDNKKGRYKKMEKARAIYNRYQLSWYWSEYDSRAKDSIFPECKYLDWNISLEQLTQIATDAISTMITTQIHEATKFANRQAEEAQLIINQELQNFTKLLASDIPNIVSFKANLSLQIKSQLTDILLTKANTDKDIHIEQQGEGVKRQIWFALLKWKALNGLQEGVTAKRFIWCFDEPETHLYPKAQREFFDLIKTISRGNIQSLISTHSTVFIDRANFSSICKVELLKGYTLYSKCTSVPDIYHALQVKNSDFLFYDKFLIVEGDTEEYLFPHLFKIVKNKTLLSCGVQIVNLGGKDKRSQNKQILNNVLRDFNKHNENIVYIFDNDVVFNGLTNKELDEITHFRVGKQDIEDSIPLSVWFDIINQVIPEAEFSFEDIEKIHKEIPSDVAIDSNKKFYKKLRSELKKKLKNNKNFVDERLPDKGKKSAEFLFKYITKIEHIDTNIVDAFNKLTE